MKEGRVEKLLIILILMFILAIVFVCLHLHALWITLMLVLLTVIALSYTIYKKKYKYLLVYLPTFILWLTLIASPAYCEYRYAYPIFLALPVYLGMNFIKEGNNEDGTPFWVKEDVSHDC